MILALVTAMLATPSSDTTLTVGGAEIPLVFVEAGTFARNLPDGRPQEVVLTTGFWLGKYEVTWDVWDSVMGSGPDPHPPDQPARRLTWIQIQDFLERATDLVDGWAFRLPTEAEWEYAARADTKSPWASGPDSVALLDYAWIRANAGGAVQEVGTRRPNQWGLYDMHGNVWEWVSDWMGPYPPDATVVDPAGPVQGEERVRRGGSVVYSAAAARSSTRYQQPPDRGNGNLGFRVVAQRETGQPRSASHGRNESGQDEVVRRSRASGVGACLVAPARRC